MKRFPLIAVVAVVAAAGLVACDNKEDPPPNYPPQPYPGGQQQPYPGQQPYPQPYPGQQPAPYPTTAPQPYPQPYPTQTAPAPAPGSTTGADTATSLPGVMKRPDGTCYVTLPALNGQAGTPTPVLCPPGS
ncbi:MAG TPA: hypothetical protein ENK23_03400 [Sorangium sp.]|nr:hypothetical protein [Sorangium sp.]